MYQLVTSWDLQAKMTCLRIKSLLVTGSPQTKIPYLSIMFNPQHLLKPAQLKKRQVKASRTLRDSLRACEGTRRHWCLQGIHRLKDGDEKINRYLDYNVESTNTEGKQRVTHPGVPRSVLPALLRSTEFWTLGKVVFSQISIC